MNKRNKILLYVLMVLSISCKKNGKFYGGYQTRDFTGTWVLRAKLLDHKQNGFDSSDITQHIPASADLQMRMFENGNIEHWNRTDLYLTGKWAVTERVSAGDRQYLNLRPNMINLDGLHEIDVMENGRLVIFYYWFVKWDANYNAIYDRKGYLYERPK